ncbi:MULTISPECIES: hypothetical protein [unclassified Sporosarcina]|uniref:DUF1659 domain-containing protein n=1 Tax=unclassified Sporosarcina TaxID=2647733 RepID=UPI00057AC06E|nr:hypothetical protein [Sporosarcina sp. ZBG7A]
MAAVLEFQTAVGKIFFNAGSTPDGRLIRKSKSYRFVEQNATPANLQLALASLGQLSSMTVMSYEKIVTSEITD